MRIEEVRALYDEWAPYYNPTHRWTLPRRRTARLTLGAATGDRVLDLACGTGLNFRHLRELVGPTGRVVGVDISPRMLAVARRTVARLGWLNVEIVEADAAQLPFADAAFARVICTYALNIIPEYVQALEEIRRVLAPGGRFVALEARMWHGATAGWMTRLGRICAVDAGHDTQAAIKRVFPDATFTSYWRGTVFMAAAMKPS